MHALLICTACGARLRDRIEIRSTKDPAIVAPVFEDQQPLTPSGQAIQSHNPIQWSFDPENPAKLEFVPQFWLNPDDVDDAIEPVDYANRLNGCCGLDGSNGPNMRCKACGEEVGTLQSDCWTAFVFIPEPGATQWIETEQ